MAHRKSPKTRKTAKTGDGRTGGGRTGGGRTGNARTSGQPTGGRGGSWLYGVHPAMAALENADRVIERLVVNPRTAERLGPDLDAALAARALTPETINAAAIAATLPDGAVHQGIAVLVGPRADPDLAEVCRVAPGSAAVVLVLDQVTDPRNFGAIMRSAAAFGARAVIATRRHAPPESGALAKAASGALEALPVIRVPNLARALTALADLGYWRVGLAADAPEPLAAIAAEPLKASELDQRAVALVLGAEGKGLRRLTRENCDSLARIGDGSLNVSVAAAIALYEVTRS